mgnify:CR=1 FL=1
MSRNTFDVFRGKGGGWGIEPRWQIAMILWVMSVKTR